MGEGERHVMGMGLRNTDCAACAVLSCFSHARLFVTLWTVPRQALLPMEFSRQGYWSGLPCPPPEDLLDAGIKPVSLMSLELAGRLFTTSTTKIYCIKLGSIAIIFQ